MGRPSSVSFIPKGFRDVYWCNAGNEPMIVEYRDNEPFCPFCKRTFEPEYDLDDHQFICHILKPWVHE